MGSEDETAVLCDRCSDATPAAQVYELRHCEHGPPTRVCAFLCHACHVEYASLIGVWLRSPPYGCESRIKH